jgi:hypothetical protein
MLMQEFSVGAVLRNVAGGGHLTIGPDQMELTVGPLSKRVSGVQRLRHRGTDVVMYRARAMPPWMDFSVVVCDGTRTALATGPFWLRKRLKRSLQEAGFRVTERVTWFQRGNAG